MLQPGVIAIVWGALVVVTFLTKGAFNPAKCNNFQIFRGVFEHAMAGSSLYGLYPGEYADCNHYGPLFSLIIAPFAILPRVAGLFLWQLFIASSLYFAIWKMPAGRTEKGAICWIVTMEVLSALQMQQFNLVTAALICSTYTALRNQRRGWAAFFMAVGMLVKIYGIVGIVFFLFFDKKWRSTGWILLWLAVLFVAPMAITSPEYVMGQYVEWIHSLAEKNMENGMAANNLQNISVFGMAHRLSGCEFSDLWILLPAVMIVGIQLLQIKAYNCQSYQWGILASMLMCVILFSTGSESSGYVIALLGVGIWFMLVARRPQSRLDWILLFGAVLVCGFGGSDLLPKAISRGVVRAYALKALPVLIVWLVLNLQLFRISRVCGDTQQAIKRGE